MTNKYLEKIAKWERNDLEKTAGWVTIMRDGPRKGPRREIRKSTEVAWDTPYKPLDYKKMLDTHYTEEAAKKAARKAVSEAAKAKKAPRPKGLAEQVAARKTVNLSRNFSLGGNKGNKI